MRANRKFSIIGSVLLWILGLSKTYVKGINMKITISGSTKSCRPSYTLCITLMVTTTKYAWIGNPSFDWKFLDLSLHHWPCHSTYTSYHILTLHDSRSYPIKLWEVTKQISCANLFPFLLISYFLIVIFHT